MSPAKKLPADNPIETLATPNLFDKSTAQVFVAPLYDGLLYRVSGTEETPSYKDYAGAEKWMCSITLPPFDDYNLCTAFDNFPIAFCRQHSTA
jgi:hypothetical protein